MAHKRITTVRGEWQQLGLETQFIIHKGTVCQAYCYTVGGLYCYYVDIDMISQYHDKIAKQVGATLCGNVRHLYRSDMVTIYDMVYDGYTAFQGQYSYVTDNKRIERITQHHHTHVRLRDIYGSRKVVTLKGDEAYLCDMLDDYGGTEAMHATFIVYLRTLDQRHKQLFIGILQACGRINKDMLKQEGTLCKQMQGLTGFDLSKIFELAVLINRVNDTVNWDEEKQHRVRPNCVNMSYEEILAGATKLFSIAKSEGKKPLKMEWIDYWQQRLAMAPSGAIHSQYPEDVTIYKGIERESRHKKTFLAELNNSDQNFWLRRTPEISAYTSVKYEWGKVRALYGCDITSHINADYGLLQCEDSFPSFIPTGMNANTQYVKEVIAPIKNMVPLCYDYDDFNSQHSLDGMAAVIDAWLIVYKDELTSQQIDAVRWTGASVMRQIVNNSESGDKYFTKGTLFSGWRLTTFVNTALNYIYLDKAGISRLAVYSIHNGDDVYAGTRTIGDALKLVNNAAKINVRANMNKMSIGTIAEFLRMDMRAENPTSVQYLTRSISTFVHSRIETDAPLKLRSLIKAYNTRYNEILERGGSEHEVKRLYRKQLFFAGKLFNVTSDFIKEVIEADEISGGMTKNGIVRDCKYIDVSIGGTVPEVYNQGITDYTTYLARNFSQAGVVISKRNVAKKFSTMYNKKLETMVKVDASRSALINERVLKGAWCGMKGVNVINKLRMGVSDIIMAVQAISPECANVLSKCDDPIRWVSILY